MSVPTSLCCGKTLGLGESPNAKALKGNIKLIKSKML